MYPLFPPVCVSLAQHLHDSVIDLASLEGHAQHQRQLCGSRGGEEGQGFLQRRIEKRIGKEGQEEGSVK